MDGSPHANWSRSRIFRWLVRLGAVKSTVVATLIIVTTSLALYVVIMLVGFHRVSWLGVFMSGLLPLVLVPLPWYPFARISEQLQATESRLRASEARHRSILEKMSEAYVEVDREGRLTFFNDPLCRIAGYPREELEGRSITDFIPRREFLRFRSSAEQAARDKSVGRVFDCPITGKDGATRFLDASFSRLDEEDGRWTGYHGVLFDATARIAGEREKKVFENQLLRAKRMESLGLLAGGVAHDLNNILCGIVGYPDLLLLDCPEEGPLRDALLAIKGSGEKAASIVQDLLTLSRRGVITTEVVSVSEIVADYLKGPEHARLVRLFPGIAVAVDLDPGPLNIEGSRHHLSTSVMNLVQNAFEAIVPPGTVSLSTARRHIDGPLDGHDQVPPGEYVTLTVADSGVGIAPQDVERVFEPFYTRKIMGRSGTGLGMSVVWGTVKDHRGHITVASEAGKGSSFALFLPATRRGPAAATATPVGEQYPGHGESVVVVDDMGDQRLLVTRLLGRLGYRVHAVSSGEEAVAYLAGAATDLLILDMILDPGMDGLDTYRKAQQVRPGLKAIITSGFSETDRVREALRLGAGPYVRKPYRLETLARVVHEALRKP